MSTGTTGLRSGRIVVGVSGSAASSAALAWAHERAKRRDWTLDVVAAWPDLGEPTIHEVPGHFNAARGRAVAGLNAALAACGVELDGPTVRVWVENDDPVEALVARCEGADLLVLGTAHDGRSRRRGLPSVHELCLGRVRCPVVQVDFPDGDLRSSA